MKEKVLQKNLDWLLKYVGQSYSLIRECTSIDKNADSSPRIGCTDVLASVIFFSVVHKGHLLCGLQIQEVSSVSRFFQLAIVNQIEVHRILSE